MEETQYLNLGTLLVTSTRIEIDGQTFAVRNVGSVKVTRPGRPWFAGVFALLLTLTGLVRPADLWLALLLGLGLAAYVVQQLRTRNLVLVSGGGEIVALASKNGQQIEQLRAAIAQAISAR